MGKFKRPLHAEFQSDSRYAGRSILRLSASASTKSESQSESQNVLIHDLSETGLRFETVARLEVSDLVNVDLPFIGMMEARIIWHEDDFYGCQFLEPVSQDILSAALLRSYGDGGEPNPDAAVEEIPIGVNPSLEAITEWKVGFEQTKGKKGYTLVGFRQTAEGVTIAIVNRIN